MSDYVGAKAKELVRVDGLTPLQWRVINLTANGMTVAEAARDLGISTDTIRRWYKNTPEYRPAFEEAVRKRAGTHEELSIRAQLIAVNLLDDAFEATKRGLAAKKSDGSEDISNQLKAADQVYKIIGMGKLQYTQNQTNIGVLTITSDDIEAARQLRQQVIEAEVVGESES